MKDDTKSTANVLDLIRNEKLTEAELSQEFLDAVYDEMMDFSALSTEFIINVLTLSENNDEMYELVARWFRSTNTMERKHFESLMEDELRKNNLS